MGKSMNLSLAKIMDLDPSPISCMTLNHQTKKLALFRGGGVGQIEIWEVSHQPFLVKVIFDLENIEEKASVESIIWADGRLFSCGLHGFILEHDISTGRKMSKTVATSGPVWCLASNPAETFIAAGTEDGFVNIFQIERDSLSYVKVLDRQEGRVLCLQWSPCSKYIATGSLDSVRLWDVEKGHAVQRLTTGRSKNKETIVWTVLILDGLTIVSGDSRGIVSFWDGRIGALKFKIQTHKADVLTLRLSTDKSCIYASGVDPVILILTKMGTTDKWVKSHPRNIHFNDVLSLETFGNRLFSGGIDADLGVSSFPPKIIVKFPPLPKAPYVFTTKDSRVLLVKKTRGLTIWKLPTENSTLTKLLELKSKNEENIFSICLNGSGTVFGYSTLKTINFFYLDPTLPTTTIHKIKFRAEVMKEPPTLHFMSNDTVLLISGRLISFIKIDETMKAGSIGHVDKVEFEISNVLGSNESHICLTSENNRILIYTFKEEALSICCEVLKHNSIPTAAAFHPIQNFILITFADHFFLIFDFELKKIIYQETVKKRIDDLFPFIGVSWSPKGNSALLYQIDCLYLLQINSQENDQEKSIKRTKKNHHFQQQQNLNFVLKNCSTKYKYLGWVGFSKNNNNNEEDIVAVEIGSLIDKLPPSFIKKRFGS